MAHSFCENLKMKNIYRANIGQPNCADFHENGFNVLVSTKIA